GCSGGGGRAGGLRGGFGWGGRAGSQKKRAGGADPIAMDRSDARGCHSSRRAGMAQSCAPAVSDRLAPKRRATRPAARQRPPPDAEIVGGGGFLLTPPPSNHQLLRAGGARPPPLP